MAIVGLAYLAIAPFPEMHTDGGLPTYGKGVVAARMVSADLTYEKSEATLEADNVTVESDSAITGGSLTMVADHFSDEARVMAFGVVKTTEDDGGEVYDTTAATPPYVGAGFIQTEQVSGVVSHKATWVFKTQFAPQGISARTKGKSTEYQTVTVNGAFMGVQINENDPTFVRERRFTKLGEAQAWINKWANITAAAA